MSLNANHSATETLICSTLIEMMQTQPWYTIKVTDLVKMAHISRSTFYVYFDSVYAVLQKLVEDFLALFPSDDTMTDSNIERHIFNDYAASSLELNAINSSAQQRHIYTTLTGPNGDSSLYTRMRNRFVRIHSDIFRSQSPRLPESNLHLLSLFFAGGKMAVTDYFYHHADSMDEELYTEFMVNFATDLFSYALRLSEKTNFLDLQKSPPLKDFDNNTR